MIACTMKLLCATFVFLVGLVLLDPTGWTSLMAEADATSEGHSTLLPDLTRKFAGVTICGFSLTTSARNFVHLLQPFMTPSQNIRARASKADFKAKLGYMDEVKGEIDAITQLLSSPSTMPTFWDLLVPEGWIVLARVVAFLKRAFFNPQALRSCRIVIFVDDLDRCPPAKVVEVLQALVLLSENTPFITFLAVDPRVIVNAIECENAGFYRAAGITGYEYLDKIIQVPFAFPTLSDHDKGKLFRGFLTGRGEIDYVEFVDTAGDRCRYELIAQNKTIQISINGGKKFTGEAKFFTYINGELFDSNGRTVLPYSIADSLVRQIVSLANRRIPPCPVEMR